MGKRGGGAVCWQPSVSFYKFCVESGRGAGERLHLAIRALSERRGALRLRLLFCLSWEESEIKLVGGGRPVVLPARVLLRFASCS